MRLSLALGATLAASVVTPFAVEAAGGQPWILLAYSVLMTAISWALRHQVNELRVHPVNTPVKAAVGATSQFVRYHVDNGDGFALCRLDYALNPQTTQMFRDWVPGNLHRCHRNGCLRAWTNS